MHKLKNINNKTFHHNLIKFKNESIINDNDRLENCPAVNNIFLNAISFSSAQFLLYI